GGRGLVLVAAVLRLVVARRGNVVAGEWWEAGALRLFHPGEGRRGAAALPPILLVPGQRGGRPHLPDAVRAVVAAPDASPVPGLAGPCRTALSITGSTHADRRLTRTGSSGDGERWIPRVWQARAPRAALVSGDAALDHRRPAHYAALAW